MSPYFLCVLKEQSRKPYSSDFINGILPTIGRIGGPGGNPLGFLEPQKIKVNRKTRIASPTVGKVNRSIVYVP